MGNRVSEDARKRIIKGARKSGAIQRCRSIERYYANPRHCKCCNIIIPWEKKSNVFCDHRCSARYNNLKRAPVRYCQQCGNSIHGESKNRKFCSTKCFQDYRWQQEKNRIQETGIATQATRSTKIAKRYLLEIKGHQCEICGQSEWMEQPIPIILDHINGHADDWRVTNLRLICPNCDAQTPTYKGKNIGNGRHKRRQRYAEGKSY